jgi:phage shock protein E
MFSILIYKSKPNKTKPQQLLIDVRTRPEWLRNNLSNSINIPYDQLHTLNVDRATKLVVYCNSGKRAKIGKETLEKLGYSDVDVLVI